MVKPITKATYRTQPTRVTRAKTSVLGGQITGLWGAHAADPFMNSWPGPPGVDITNHASTPILRDPIHGSVFNFNGTSQYLQQAFTVSGNTYPLMLAAWFYPVSVPAANGTIIALTPSGATTHIFQLFINGGNGFNIVEARQYNSGSSAATGSALVNNVWHRAVAVFNSATSRTLYLDGVKVATDTGNSGTASGMNQINIGCSPWAGPGEFFPGRIGMVMVANYSPTLAEVEADYFNTFAYLNPPRRPFFKQATSGGVQSYSYTASGGLTLGGVSTIVRSEVYSASGGETLGGSSATVRSEVYNAHGGETLGGSSATIRGEVYSGKGGAVLGGSAVEIRGTAPKGMGGILFGGVAAIVKTALRTATGGILFGGSAPYSHQSIGAKISTWITIARRRLRR